MVFESHTTPEPQICLLCYDIKKKYIRIGNIYLSRPRGISAKEIFDPGISLLFKAPSGKGWKLNCKTCIVLHIFTVLRHLQILLFKNT